MFQHLGRDPNIGSNIGPMFDPMLHIVWPPTSRIISWNREGPLNIALSEKFRFDVIFESFPEASEWLQIDSV